MEEQPSFANNKAAAEFCIRSKDICKCAHIYDFYCMALYTGNRCSSERHDTQML